MYSHKCRKIQKLLKYISNPDSMYLGYPFKKKDCFPKGKQNPLCEGIASINVLYQHAISPLNVGRPEITLESGL